MTALRFETPNQKSIHGLPALRNHRDVHVYIHVLRMICGNQGTYQRQIASKNYYIANKLIDHKQSF